VRLDDGEGALQGHLKLQTDGLKQTSKPADYTRVRGKNIRAASSRSARGNSETPPRACLYLQLDAAGQASSIQAAWMDSRIFSPPRVGSSEKSGSSLTQRCSATKLT